VPLNNKIDHIDPANQEHWGRYCRHGWQVMRFARYEGTAQSNWATYEPVEPPPCFEPECSWRVLEYDAMQAELDSEPGSIREWSETQAVLSELEF
jgi:hypothetical protein